MVAAWKKTLRRFIGTMESWKGEREKDSKQRKERRNFGIFFSIFIYRSDFITNEKDWLRLFS